MKTHAPDAPGSFARRARRAAVATLVLPTLVLATLALPRAPVLADPAPAAADPSADAVIAKELFQRGLALMEAKDYERALEYFTRSRAVYPASSNTANAAICLDRLGRWDEALELYEELLVKFKGTLDAEDQAAIAPAMAELRKKVGSVRVSANVEGTVVIDGRPRGKLPLAASIRVLAGKHVLRVLKDGHAPFERSFEVAAGDTITLDASLAALADAGALRVEDPDNPGSELFVDQVRVGTTPWEGTLGPGRHVVWTRAQDRGSAPAAVVVLQGQTVLLRAVSAALGPPVRIDVDPVTAEISIDGVAVAKGSWEGRLPVGRHDIAASEDGYSRRASTITLAQGEETPAKLTLQLPVDPEHPRWPRPSLGQPWLGAFAGVFLGQRLGSDAESYCDGSCSRASPGVLGGVVGLRAAYGFRRGPALEIGAAYAAFHAALSRTVVDSYGPAGQYQIAYHAEDDIALRGFLLSGGLSHRIQLAPRLSILSRITGGVLFAAATDPVEASAGGTSFLVSDRDQALTAVLPFVAPELGIEVRFGPIVASVSLASAFFVSNGPRFSHAQTGNPNPELGCGTSADPASAACAPNSDALANEAAYGLFMLWSPQIGARYEL